MCSKLFSFEQSIDQDANLLADVIFTARGSINTPHQYDDEMLSEVRQSTRSRERGRSLKRHAASRLAPDMAHDARCSELPVKMVVASPLGSDSELP
jgi:hypothetical protein